MLAVVKKSVCSLCRASLNDGNNPFTKRAIPDGRLFLSVVYFITFRPFMMYSP